MSSSKVIKSNALQEHSVSAICYRALSGEAGLGRVYSGGEGFVPFNFNDADLYEAPAELPVVEEVPPPAEVPLDEGMMLVSEEEAQLKLEEAFQKGVDEGRQGAERGLANVFKSLREGIAGINGLREKVLRESEDDLLKLSIMVAKKIIQQEISQNPQILANIVAATISSCVELDKINIRLNPEDHELVAANRQLYLSGSSQNMQITLTPDDGIMSGGCMVETVTGTIDARIEVQLDEIYRSFMEERGTPLKQLVEEGQNADATN